MKLHREQVEEKDYEIETLKFITETITTEVEEAKIIAEEKIQVAEQSTSETKNQQEAFDKELQKQKEQFEASYKLIRNEYQGYRIIANEELRVKDEVIDRLRAIVQKQMDEMKAMKTVISIPVLRN